MNVIILEDELIATKRLQRQLMEINTEINVLECFESVMDLSNYLLSNPHPDILLLDINVVDGSSFELFNVVDVESKIIFTTAYSEFAVDAFKKNAIHYLMKPIRLQELSDAIQRCESVLNSTVVQIQSDSVKTVQKFMFKFASKLHLVRVDEIAYIYSKDKMSFFVNFEGKRTPSDYKLQYLETQLNPNDFFRINRQVIVHREAITDMMVASRSRLLIRLNPPYGKQIFTSTEKTPLFKEWLS